MIDLAVTFEFHSKQRYWDDDILAQVFIYLIATTVQVGIVVYEPQ